MKNSPFDSLPNGLTYSEVAQRLGFSFSKARRLITRYGYKAIDGRTLAHHQTRKFKPEEADWCKSPTALAREWGVSKQRVSAVAKKLGIKIVDSRGRRKQSV